MVPHVGPPGGAACGPQPSPPFVAGASPPGVRVWPGSWGSPGSRVRPAAGGSAWRGGGEGGACEPPPPGGVAGGPSGAWGCSALVRPSVFPGQAPRRASLATLRSWGAWPPYCSGSLSRAAPRRGPCVVLVRWRGFACLSRPWREQAVMSVGACGVRAQLRPPPGRRGPFRGRGDVPSASERVEGRRPRGPQAGGGSGRERGGGAVPWFPTPLPWGVAPGPRPSSASSPAHSPWVYAFSWGCWAAPGAGRGLLGHRLGQPGGGGGGGCQCAVPPGARLGGSAGSGAGRSLCRGLFPRLPRAGTKAGRFVCALPSMLHSWVSSFRCGPWGPPERWRRATGRQRAPRELVGGLLGALGARPRWPRLWRPSPPRPSRGGGGAAASLAGLRPSSGRGGGGGGGGGGFPAVPPWSPGVATRQSRGGGLVVPVPGGQPPTGGGAHPSSATLHSLGARPSCRPSLGPPALLAVAAQCRKAGGGGRAGECWGLWSGSAVSRPPAAGQWASPRARCPRPLPYWRWCAPLRRGVRLGGWGSRSGSGGPAPLAGVLRGTVPSPSPRAHRPGRRGAVVICVVACVGAGAATEAGCAGGSASL